MLWKIIKEDLAAAKEKDPAARNKLEIIFTYGGFRGLVNHRFAHWFWQHKMFFIAKLLSAKARKKYGMDIHPAATFGKRVFIDHAVGLVIGETAEIGDNVTLYQGVTLGGTGKDTGKRHPTIKNNVMISCGAKVLGPVTIGEYSKIGSGSVVLKDVPPHCTVVGVPGRIVRQNGEKYNDDELNQKLPDPVLEEFDRLNSRISALEKIIDVNCSEYEINENLDEIKLDNKSKE
ncbi:MAG: serine O-acetyltransferase [Clostridia bacterium]